jgi:hypothetical protein
MSWVHVLETTSCRNAGKGPIRPKVVSPFLRPCARGSYVHCAATYIPKRPKGDNCYLYSVLMLNDIALSCRRKAKLAKAYFGGITVLDYTI